MKTKTAIEIVFIGSSGLGLQKLIENKSFSVIDVLCLESRLNQNLLKIASEHHLSIKYFKWISNFRKLINQYVNSIPFFIYQLDMLVPSDLTEKYSFFNVHRGNLYTNRGPNPDIWPILNGDKETCLTLHKINDKIDSGILIDTYDVSISPDDDTASVKKKMEEGLPLLIKSLKDFLEGNKTGVALIGGIYRPWITESDFTINLETDTVEIINRKIKSQCQYNGAILMINNEKYYVLDIVKKEKMVNDTCNIEFDGHDRIKVKSGKYIITLKINLTPQHPSPPQFPPSKRI